MSVVAQTATVAGAAAAEIAMVRVRVRVKGRAKGRGGADDDPRSLTIGDALDGRSLVAVGLLKSVQDVDL